MRFGIEIVPFGDFADPTQVVKLAQAAEAAGWEALWVWDHLLFPYGVGDPWVMLAAAAAVTRKIKLVTGVAALPRYHPHLLARLLVSLDRLSQGRVVLGAGAGALDDEFSRFAHPDDPHPPSDSRARAAMLDEGLDLLTHLWSGEPTTFQGRYYRVEAAALQPPPIQRPRPPVWIGGQSQAALRRAARWDGWIMGTTNENGAVTCPPEQVARSLAYICQQRASQAPFEVAIDGLSQPGETTLAREYAQAGAAWWFELIYPLRGSVDELLARIQAGPPAL